MSIGKAAKLTDVYRAVQKGAPERLAENPNLQAKVRQVLNQNRDLFQSVDRGVWALA